MHGHGSSTSLSYQTHYDLLINACVRYDDTKKANIGKRRYVYNSTVEPTYVDYPQDAFDIVQESPYWVYISLLMSSIRSMPFPLDIHLLLGLEVHQNHLSSPNLNNQVPKKSFKRYDGPIYLPQQIYKLLSQDAMKALKAYNTEVLNRFHKRKVHNNIITFIS